jgi:hypothetical protein
MMTCRSPCQQRSDIDLDDVLDDVDLHLAREHAFAAAPLLRLDDVAARNDAEQVLIRTTREQL